MTIEELLAREGIRRTMSSHTVVGDRLRGDDFIAVFTDDAVFESDGVTDIGPDRGGIRIDSFPKVEEQWLIDHRKVRLVCRSPQSLFMTAIANTQRRQG